MRTVGTLGQLIPGGKVGDKIRSFANTVSNVGSALGGRSLIAPTVNQTVLIIQLITDITF